jgi:sarcosine oxidase, subunit beta
MTVRTADVAIVGGGLMAAWIAYFLTRRGARVVVLERGLVGA